MPVGRPLMPVGHDVQAHDAANGGNVLWESVYGDVAIVDGVFRCRELNKTR